jgi:hypothetical protein
MPPIVALLTDFGDEDAYVGVMKGVMLGIHAELRLVDLCHRVAPFTVLQAAYLLYSAWDYFPPGTVFLSVVDPGVGSERGALVAAAGGPGAAADAEAAPDGSPGGEPDGAPAGTGAAPDGSRLLVAPDNGTISLLARMKPRLRAFRLRAGAAPAGRPAGATFHGRDLFAPAAARAAVEGIAAVRGEPIGPVLLPEALPEVDTAAGRISARILHIDRFGNCISAVHRDDLGRLEAGGRATGCLEARGPAGGGFGVSGPAGGGLGSGGSEGGGPLWVRLGGARIEGLRRTYADAPPGGLLAYIGSSGFLEVAVREGSAARRLRVKAGDWIEVRRYGPGRPAPRRRPPA